jgi:hypothetical protein
VSDRVRDCLLLDADGRDVSELFNAAEEVGCPPLLLAALGVAESSQPGKPRGLYERTIGDAHTRTGSHGLFQINPQYHPGHSAEWYRVAENAIDYAAPMMADNLIAAGGDWVRAMGLWNKPNGTANAAVLATYAAGLEFARAHYAIEEEPMPDPITDPTEAIRQLQAQQSLQSEAIAAILANHYQDGPQSAKGLLVQLDPNKYGTLAVVEMQPKT